MVIPRNVINSVEKTCCENVILLVMSTLPFRPVVETYQFDNNKEYVFKGISQLEAGTKYFLQKMAINGEKAARIVVMASNETLMGEDEKPAAIEVYKTRVREFIENGKSLSSFGYAEKEHQGSAVEIEESKFWLCGKYDKDFADNRIIVCRESEERIEQLLRTRDAIIGADRDKLINLYVDMQGGNRNDIPAISSVIDLIRDTGVDVVERVATEYQAQNSIQPIVNVNASYRAYELMSAYQIFKNYGWGNQLVQYFRQNETDLEIAKAIENISNAIKFCDVNEFDEGLENLAVAIQKREKTNQRSDMDLLMENIQKDFGSLLDNREEDGFSQRPLKYINQIRWCLKKGFSQQALTVFESKMPTEFVWNGFVCYCRDKGKKEEVLEVFKNCYTWLNKRDKYKMIDLNHFWIFCLRNKFYTAKLPKPIYGTDQKKCKSLIRMYGEICKKRNEVNHASDKWHNPSGFYSMMRKLNPRDENFKGKPDADIEEMIKTFLNKFEEEAKNISDEIKREVVDLA